MRENNFNYFFEDVFKLGYSDEILSIDDCISLLSSCNLLNQFKCFMSLGAFCENRYTSIAVLISSIAEIVYICCRVIK